MFTTFSLAIRINKLQLNCIKENLLYNLENCCKKKFK